MEQDTELPEKFTDGVWYDLETGDSVRFVETDEGVGLTEPDRPSAQPYYLFNEEYDDTADIHNTIEADFYEVPESAIADPASYVVSVLDKVQGDAYGATGGPSMEEQIGLSYARQQVEVSESE